MPRLRTVVLASLCALTLSIPIGATAADDVIRVRGTCNGPSTWKLITRQYDPTTLLVRVEIAGGAAGQEWAMFVDVGDVKLIRNRKISGDGGLVKWARRTPDQPGTAYVKMNAVNTVTSETCAGALAF